MLLDLFAFHDYFTKRDFSVCLDLFRGLNSPSVSQYGETRPERYANFLKKKMVPALANYIDGMQKRSMLKPYSFPNNSIPFVEAWNFITKGKTRYEGDYESACYEVAKKFANKFLYDAMYDNGRRIVEASRLASSPFAAYDAMVNKVEEGNIKPIEVAESEVCFLTGLRFGVGIKNWRVIAEPIEELSSTTVRRPKSPHKPVQKVKTTPHLVTFDSGRIIVANQFAQEDMAHISAELAARKSSGAEELDLTGRYLRDFSMVYIQAEKSTHHVVLSAKNIIIGRAPETWELPVTSAESSTRYAGKFESDGVMSIIDESVLLGVMTKRLGYWKAKMKLNNAVSSGEMLRVQLPHKSFELCFSGSARPEIRNMFLKDRMTPWSGLQMVSILHQV